MKELEVYVTALDPADYPDYNIEASEDAFIHLLEARLNVVTGSSYDQITVGIKAHELADSVRQYKNGEPCGMASGYINDLVAQIVEDVHNKFDWLVKLDTNEYPEDTATP